MPGLGVPLGLTVGTGGLRREKELRLLLGCGEAASSWSPGLFIPAMSEKVWLMTCMPTLVIVTKGWR